MGHVKRTWIVENNWTCDSCGQVNRGRDMECIQCGSPKEKREEYDTSGAETAPEVTDTEMLKQARAGHHWECEYCQYENRDLLEQCGRCGAERWSRAERDRRVHNFLSDGNELKKARYDQLMNNPGKMRYTERGPTFEPDKPFFAEELKGSTHDPEPDSWPPTHACGPVEPKDPEYTLVGGDYRNPPKRVPKPPEPPEPPPPPPTLGERWEALVTRLGAGWGAFHRGASANLREQWKILLTLLAILAVGSLLVWAFVPHEITAEVASKGWRYTRELQQRKLNHGTGWDGDMPAHSFNVTCVTRQHGTENCNPYDCNCRSVTDYCSTTCNCRTTCSDNGTGYSTCSETCSTCREACGSHTECSTCYEQCPVYDEWCDYDYYTWPTIDREVTRGMGDSEPEWGTRLVVNPNAPHPQRIQRHEWYAVMFQHDEDEYAHSPGNLQEYSRYRMDAQWMVKVNRAGMIWPEYLIQE